MNLEHLLRDRLTGDPRALIGVLDIEHDRVFLRFGTIGPLIGITLSIQGESIWQVAPALGEGAEPFNPAAEFDRLRGVIESQAAEIVALHEAAAADPNKAPGEKDAETGVGGSGGPSATLVAAGSPAGAQTAPAPGGEGSETVTPEVVDPNAHSHAALLAIAEAEQVKVDPKASKKTIAAAINAARAPK